MTLDLNQLNRMAFAQHIGMTFESAKDGECLVSFVAQPFHGNTRGHVHGGVLPMIIDAAGATAIWSTAPQASVFSADLRVNFIAPVASGQKVEARGHVVHRGGSTAYAAVTVMGEDGTTLALGQVTGVIKRSQPTP
jgi:uncharacterized protein (TIGR00369 family)